jgi:Tol biopolymer transport system component/predicted Ser/Thr protein kinase
MTLERGTLLHKRYRIVEILGQGGMGSVYRALDENLGVEVAVKENLFTTDEYARQFRLEAVILANLRHPNLPRVTDHFVIGDQGQYLIMDYIEGEDLRQRMERQGVISEEEAILIGAAMCDALDYLHSRKPSIIHRDVKPGNVKITPDGRIYLVDFGLAKIVKGSQATTTGARAMTPGYSPPEQYGTARTDARTDIYSLGATLYAALTGVIPEDGLARAMDNVDLTPIRKRNPRVSRRLAAAIEKAMAVRPEDRFQSALEFKEALLSSNVKTQRVEGEIVVAPPPSGGTHPESGEVDVPPPDKPITAQLIPLSRPASTPRRRKRMGIGCWVMLTLALLFMAAGVLLVTFWPGESNPMRALFFPLPTPTLGEVVTLPTATPLPVVEEWTPTPTLTPTRTPYPTATFTPTETLEPSATPLGGAYGQLAFASARNGVPQIFLMNSDGSGQVQLTDLPDGACQPAWSPDGSQIVFISPCRQRGGTYPDARLYLIDADGSGLTLLLPSTEGDSEPAWSPDGTRIAFTSRRDGYPRVYVLDLRDNTAMPLTGEGIQASQPAWSPRGDQIAYATIRYNVSQIWVMSATGVAPQQLVRSGADYWDTSPVWSPDGETIFYTQFQRGILTRGWLMSIRYENRNSEGRPLRSRDFAVNATLSTDGQWLFFESADDTGNIDIYRMRVAGNNLSRLTNDRDADFDPAWRPMP